MKLSLAGIKPKDAIEKLGRPVAGITLGVAVAQGAKAGALAVIPSLGKNMTPYKEAAVTAGSGGGVVVATHMLLQKVVLKGKKAKSMATKMAKAALVGVLVAAVLPLATKAIDKAAGFIAQTIAKVGGKKMLPAATATSVATVVDMSTGNVLGASSTEAKVAARNAERAAQVGGPTLRPRRIGGVTIRPQG